MGDARFGWKWVAIAIVPFALLGMSSAGQPDFRATYPFWRGAGGSASAFVMYELFRAAVFYLAWEFFYRGFIQFGLAPSIGPWNAILVQTLASCLWHIGLPTGELLSSIAGGIFFGIIAWRSGSWIYPLILHIALGVSLDAAVCFF
jgi:membrane protease YdiL (CAAX protease family)